MVSSPTVGGVAGVRFAAELVGAQLSTSQRVESGSCDELASALEAAACCCQYSVKWLLGSGCASLLLNAIYSTVQYSTYSKQRIKNGKQIIYFVKYHIYS